MPMQPGSYTLAFAAQGYLAPAPVQVKEGKTETVEPVVMQEVVGSPGPVYLPSVRRTD